MKILLLGEYSNVHWTLAQALRAMGHTVCVVSNGDFWKDYRRDISLVRKNPDSKWDGILYWMKVKALLPKLTGYDVVQLINPMFLELKAQRIEPIYRYLRRHNGKLFLDAYGMDYYWVHTCTTTRTFRYSDFNIGDRLVTNAPALAERKDWADDTAKSRLNRYIAQDCDGIVAGMYEYYACYKPLFPDKTVYIPFPIDAGDIKPVESYPGGKVNFFIGIQKARSQYKGTDILYRALLRLKENYPNLCEIKKAESVPFEEYKRLLRHSHVLIDQLYGYSPGMNALLAMSAGQVVVGGGEPEYYEMLHEEKMRPIVNVLPDEKDVYDKLEQLLLHPLRIAPMQEESRRLVLKHHDPRGVAQQYIDVWKKSIDSDILL